MTVHVVVMGVAGCGKSAVGALLARELGLPFIEGDSFHPAGNVAKMRQGLPLTDADRAGWLARLGEELRAHPEGAVLTCSALKRAYRDTLRAAAPGLRFVYLQVTPGEAAVRVAARSGHFYPASLVDSQFEALQEPQGEEGVCTVGAGLPVEEVARAAARALAGD